MIRVLITIHKADSPIRPRVNWKDDPVYNLAWMLARNVEMFIPLQYIFNIKNTIPLINDLLDIQFEQDLKLVSFDTMNMYSNIPITEVIKIIEITCKQNDLNIEIKNEIIKMCNILTWKNSRVSTRTKLRIFCSNVKSVLLYGSETWKEMKTNTSKLQTFVNRCL